MSDREDSPVLRSPFARQGAQFHPTRWSLVARASTNDTPESKAALESLCRAYWWPLYAYLRRRGFDGNASADAVQGLFADLIEKRRLAHADPLRGRFRSWLLTALKFHLSHERERGLSAKRGGRIESIALDRAEAERRWDGSSRREDDPERVFERDWAITTLERAMAHVQADYEQEGEARLYAALKPGLTDEPDRMLLQAIGADLGISTSAVKSAAVRFRKRMHQAIRAEVRATLGEQEDVEEDVRALFAALSTG